MLAVFAGLLTGLVYAAASYPLALTPVVVLPIYTAASVLPQRRARWLLAGGRRHRFVDHDAGSWPDRSGGACPDGECLVAGQLCREPAGLHG